MVWAENADIRAVVVLAQPYYLVTGDDRFLHVNHRANGGENANIGKKLEAPHFGLLEGILTLELRRLC